MATADEVPDGTYFVDDLDGGRLVRKPPVTPLDAEAFVKSWSTKLWKLMDDQIAERITAGEAKRRETILFAELAAELAPHLRQHAAADDGEFIEAAKQVAKASSHPQLEDAYDKPILMVSRNDWISAKAVACAYLAALGVGGNGKS